MMDQWGGGLATRDPRAVGRPPSEGIADRRAGAP
jgi:hypothetical protein